MDDKKFKPFPVLKTARLTLRQLAGSDGEEIFALRSSDSVNEYLERRPATSINDARAFIETITENILQNNSMYWAITLNGTDTLAGTICLFGFSADNMKAEIGFELLPHLQGKGIMQEAIAQVTDYGRQHAGLHTIEACTHIENQRSIRLLEKLDFKPGSACEGNFRLFTLTVKG